MSGSKVVAATAVSDRLSTTAAPRHEVSEHARSGATRLAVALGLVFGAASLARDGMLLSVFSYSVSPDSFGYIAGDPLRSRVYPVLAAITGAAQDPEGLIWLQIVLGAVATGLIVWVTARWNPILAVIAGLLLILDVNWARENREVLTEGPTASLCLISLACLVYQYEKRDSLRTVRLPVAGLLYGTAVLIRPSNVALAPAVIVLYWLFTRSWMKAAAVAAGIGLVLLANCLLTLQQTGHFRINAGTGVYVAFPLFSYHLFSPGNGPASTDLDTTIRACYPDIDYSQVLIRTSNQYIWSQFLPCLAHHGWSNDRISSELTSAYEEAIAKHPRAWSREVLDNALIFLSFPYEQPAEVTPSDCVVYRWCGSWAQGLDSRSALAMDKAFLWEQGASSESTGARQIYLLPRRLLPDNPVLVKWTENGRLPRSLLIELLLLFLGITLFLWLTTRGPIRLLVMASVGFVLYNALSVVSGHVYLPRYTVELSPFSSIVSAVLIVALVRLAVGAVIGLRHYAVAARTLVPAAAIALAMAFCLRLAMPPSVLLSNVESETVLKGPYSHYQGNAYYTTIPGSVTLRSDDSTDPYQSTLYLYEDGRPLGPSHSYHGSIFDQGSGRFSHWTTGLIFSSSDNTDPNVNGRRYTVRYPATPPSLEALPYLAAALLVFVPLAMWFRSTPPRRLYGALGASKEESARGTGV